VQEAAGKPAEALATLDSLSDADWARSEGFASALIIYSWTLHHVRRTDHG
jgi:hypothetical protein